MSKTCLLAVLCALDLVTRLCQDVAYKSRDDSRVLTKLRLRRRRDVRRWPKCEVRDVRYLVASGGKQTSHPIRKRSYCARNLNATISATMLAKISSAGRDFGSLASWDGAQPIDRVED